jgi:glutamine synthetase
MIIPINKSLSLIQFLSKELQKFNLIPVIGAEIEFYLFPLDNNLSTDLWQELALDIKREKGENQFEVVTKPDKDILKQVQTIENIRKNIAQQAANFNLKTSFEAKPFVNQPGNALHINLHLENDIGENLYIKENNQDSSILLNSIGGLCDSMQENMLLFAPYEQAYQRYINFSPDSPNKICWGGNNRSVAIRVPNNTSKNARLEHRVPCADSCAFDVIVAILFGLLIGIENNMQPEKKIFGNAFLEQYDAPKITNNYIKAWKDFQNSRLNRLYMIL